MMRRTSKIKKNFLRPQALVLALGVTLSFLAFVMHPVPQTTLPAQAFAGEPAAAASAAVDCAASKCIALTFDDGPDPVLTPQILDILKRHNVQATFFVMGRHVSGNEALLKRMHAEGHEIGNHSWNHPYFTRISLDQVREEVTSTQAAVAKAGVPAPQLFRPPYGDVNDAVLAQIPLTVVRWNIDPEDWHPKKRDNMLGHMAAFAKPGGVVVMHDTEATTAERLESLLLQLESQSFKVVTVSEALGISPGQRGVFFGR